MSKEIENRNEDIRELKIENNRNLKGINQLAKDIEEMEKEINERDDTIQDKENRQVRLMDSFVGNVSSVSILKN